MITFIIGVFIGAIVSAGFMCLFQINNYRRMCRQCFYRTNSTSSSGFHNTDP